jgi:hypothetical protein
MTLSGSPALIRNDADIFFNWKTGRPASGIPSDHFSARWMRDVGFNADTYTFFVHSDDGVRVWVDDQLIIDQWQDTVGLFYSADVTLSAGVHSLRVEYYENMGTAQIQFGWELTGAYPQWRGAYFANQDLDGIPAVIRNDVDIDFDWGTGWPVSGIPADQFSVRWDRTLLFHPGTYRFYARVDDGVRLYVDGDEVIDEWVNGSVREVSGDIQLSAGEHWVRVEYYDDIDRAVIEVWWEQIDGPVIPDWTGEYFANRDLLGEPVLERDDPFIDFDWGTSGPGSGVPSDNFSVRWTRSTEYEPGLYTLYAQVDDGVRIFVNDLLVLDQWHANAGQTVYQVERPFSDGTNTIVVEYYEGTGNALARFWMLRTGDLPP